MSVIRALRSEGSATAAKRGDVPKLRTLLWAMVDIEACDNAQRTSLMWVAMKGHTKCTRILIEAGGDLTAENGPMLGGMPSLMLAAANGRPECTRVLIEAGSDLTAKSNGNEQRTSLMYAAWKGHAECTQMLIEAGSDLTAKDMRGNTAKDIARNRGHTPVVILLEEALQACPSS